MCLNIWFSFASTPVDQAAQTVWLSRAIMRRT